MVRENDASFVIASAFPLRITEINYHPHAAGTMPGVTEAEVGDDQFEFIELMNVSDQPIDLRGVQLSQSAVYGNSQGIAFAFEAQELGPSQRIVLVRDRESFRARYGTSVRVAAGSDGAGGDSGEYSSRLSDTGGQLTLTDAAGRLIQQLSYKTGSGWPVRSNGRGSSLEILDAAGSPADPANWRASHEVGGSPGAAGTTGDGIVISEVLANTASPGMDRIELFNPGPRDVSITHWYVSDTSDDYYKSQITAPVTVPALGYFVLLPHEIGLDLDGTEGGEILLVSADANGRPLRFEDRIEFGLAGRGISLGRWPTDRRPSGAA